MKTAIVVRPLRLMTDICKSACAVASRLAFVGLLTAFAVTQCRAADPDLRMLFNDGKFEAVVVLAQRQIENTRSSGKFADSVFSGLLAARAAIQLERYSDAEKLIGRALVDAKKVVAERELLASLYFTQAHLYRIRKDFRSASSRSRDAFALAPKNRQVELEYYLTNGRILFSAGYDVAAIVWLEKAEQISTSRRSALHLEVLRFLSLAWRSKFYYGKAISYSQKLVEESQNTEFKYRHRQALYEYANLLSSSGQEHKAKTHYERGLNLARFGKDDQQSCLLLSSLYQSDIESAEKYLRVLESIDEAETFQLERLMGKAIVAAYRGESDESDRYFAKLQTLKSYSDHLVPYWRAVLAERKHDWPQLIERTGVLLKLSEEDGFREDLPDLYLRLAKGYWGSGNQELALSNARKAENIVSQSRPVGDAPLSLSMLETFHSVYRLLAEIERKSDNINSSFEIAEYLKARVLRDRIDFSPLKQLPDISPELRKKAELLSHKFLDGRDDGELDSFEQSVTMTIPNNAEPRPLTPDFHKPLGLEGTTIVSYIFASSGELGAYVLEGGHPVRFVKLDLSENETADMADAARKKIQERIFFKNDGKRLYDRLIAPLSVQTSNLIIVPDKFLWKIPFHALSPDGESYLIERKMVSYTPSVSMLVKMLDEEQPIRKTAQIYANNTFQGRSLRFVNQEAATIGKLFGVQPIIGASRAQFFKSSENSDILHFSMHAQVDAEEPLASFLAFRPAMAHNGRITVEDLTKARVKRQSLAFLASCDTSNVMEGEGLVSLAWALLGSGSTSVISAQWEANDQSTEMFAKHFYDEYRKGVSASRAMQLASIAMIKNKSSETHEPYYWAAFTLLGDFR